MAASSSPSSAPCPAPDPDVRLDTARLRVLAHPMRLNVLALLRLHGPATATRVAEALDITPGSASYHLRRLAAGGLIAEVPERGAGRERWWRAVHRQSVHDPAVEPVEQRAAGRAYAQAVALAAAERLRRAAEEVPALPPEWYAAGVYADFALRLAPDEVERLRAELFAVVDRYRRDPADAPPGAAPVTLQMQAFPAPGTMAPDTEPV
ncbi:ArsR/SmtB family transcription factor [Streptomyces sp. NPDC001478]